MSRSKRNAAAEDYFKRAPGYSAEAIGGLSLFADEIRSVEPEVAVATEHIVAGVEAATKFSLPFGGVLFDGTSKEILENWRPPFPLSVFEFEAYGITKAGVRGVFRNITLVEETDGWTYLFNATCDPSRRPKSSWEPCFFWVAFARENDGSVSGGLMDSLGRPRLAHGSSGITTGVIAAATPQLLDKLGVREDLFEASMKRMLLPLEAVTQACAALACTNVRTEILRPNSSARAARPASTLFDYHVLIIDSSKERNPSEDHGGTHASPRTHLRRGHIRRHPTAGRIWVNACAVNLGAAGTVNKDYSVSPRRAS